MISTGRKSRLLSVFPDYSVADTIFFSYLPVSRSSLIELSPFFDRIVPLGAFVLSLTRLAASDLRFAPGEHLEPTDGTVFKLTPSQSLQAVDTKIAPSLRGSEPASSRALGGELPDRDRVGIRIDGVATGDDPVIEVNTLGEEVSGGSYGAFSEGCSADPAGVAVTLEGGAPEGTTTICGAVVLDDDGGAGFFDMRAGPALRASDIIRVDETHETRVEIRSCAEHLHTIHTALQAVNLLSDEISYTIVLQCEGAKRLSLRILTFSHFVSSAKSIAPQPISTKFSNSHDVPGSIT